MNKKLIFNNEAISAACVYRADDHLCV